MYRSSSGRSGPSFSSSYHRLKEGSSSGSRSSRSSTSGPGPGRGRPPLPPPAAPISAASASPPRSASPRPPPRRHRSPSGHRGASRRSPSPHRSRRLPSPPGGLGPGGTRGRRGSEHGDGGSSSRRRSPSLRSESSLEQSLRITVGNDRYCIGTPERRRLSDRLGSPVDNLSDRDDMADGPIFNRGLSCSRGLERYPSHEDPPSSPFIMRHDEDYRNRDVFLHRSDYSPHYGRREELPHGSDRDGDKLRKPSYPSRPEERGREIKRPRYEKDEKMHVTSGEHQGFSSGTRNYRRRSHSRSQSPSYLNEEFRELDRARRKREEEERSRNLNHDVSESGYVIPGLTNTLQTSEPRYTYRPEEIPSMPKKSILKKRVEMEVESPIQPEGFSSSLDPSKDLPLLSSRSSLPQSNNTAPFASEVENFLKRFNKDSVVESANKGLHDSLYDWSPLSGAPKDSFTFEEKFGSFLSHKEKVEPKAELGDRHTDFLLPHERASQDGSGFSRILGMMADSVSAQEKRRRSFPDIEDEEKFLYGDEDEDSKMESFPLQKPPVSCGNEITNQKLSPPSSAPAAKLDPLEEPNAEYAKIHDLLKTIGLDIGVAEIGKLAVRTQERLHGKKLSSCSPDRRSSDPRRLDPWDFCRSRSDTRSPESGQQCSTSPPASFQQSKDASSLQKSEYTKNQTVGQEIPPRAPEQPLPSVSSVSLIPSVPPAPASLPPTPTSISQYQIPSYSQFTAAQMPQNYPPPTMAPPGYDAYGHYMAYAAPSWPVYPPAQQPNPTLPEAHGLLTMAMPANPTRPNLRVIETVSMRKDVPDLKRDGSVLVHVPMTPTHSKVPPRLSSHPLKNTTEKISDEKNRATQKQKVIEEREKLKNEREARQKKLYYLKTELDRLRKQQGEMLRKKRREKDGHKDPLLVEVNRLQENIVKEISELHKESDAADKKQSELDKVAQILGINIFEKPRKPPVETKDSSEKNNKSENVKGPEKTSSSNKESKTTNEKSRGRSPKPAESSSQSSKHPFQLANIYEYYDAGNHWCKDCNTICGTMFDFFTHMHNKKHRQTLDPYNRPWASKTQSETKQDSIKRIDKITVPAKGSEFLIPITGYYCQLCHEFFGDQISAEQHVKSHPHNEKYKKYIDENPLYEERRNLDRQAGLAVVLETERRRQNELKRKLVEKQKEAKDEKKPKVIKKDEANPIPELGEGTSETQDKADSSGQKMGIKLKLKKEDKEEKKEEKKEESKKESPSQTSFGKFSWKKTEREDKTPGGAVPKEETTEGNKEENKCQSGKLHVKPIEIKLSGKTVIPHTSSWTPVVSTSTSTKILPNLPVPTMIFRKTTATTVSKPAPLNTFLSIKSSGAITKPLPVVKETNADLLLPPDIISKAFGGEEVILKGAEEDLKEAENSRPSQTSDIPPPPPHPPAVQQVAVIPADEVAPGVSESEQTMLATPVRPPPLPPSTAFSDQAKKVEKRNSCLATANAKDLYDIFYSSGGKSSADSKLASSVLPNGDNSNLTKPADLSANPRRNNSSSSLKEDSQNVVTDISQGHSAENSSELEKTGISETLICHNGMNCDTENDIQKDVGKKFQTSLSIDAQTELREGSSQCNNQVTESCVLGENQAETDKESLQPQLPEMLVTEFPETKTASGIGLVDIGDREQADTQELSDLQKTEVQKKVGQENTNKTAVTKTDVPGSLKKDMDMKDWEVQAVNAELTLHPKTLLTQNEIKNLGSAHLEEERLSDNCRTHLETDSPDLLCESQNISKEKALVAVLTEQNSVDASLKHVKLKSVPQPGVLDKAPRTSETQNRILELTGSEWDTSRTCSNGEEQIITTCSCSESSCDIPDTPNAEIKTDSNEVSASELTEVQPDTYLAKTETRSSILEAQETVRPEPSDHVLLDNQTQEQEVAHLGNACSANVVELGSSVELAVEVDKKSLGCMGSDATLGSAFIQRDAKEIGTGGFPRVHSDLVQGPVVALSANFHRKNLSEEAVHSSETKPEVVRNSPADDFLNTTHLGLNTEQSESLSENVHVDNEKVSLTSEDVKHSKTPSQKPELEFKSTDFHLGDTKECFNIRTVGLLNENAEVSKVETVASIRLESDKLKKLGTGKTVDETEITDFATLTSDSQEDKFCTQISQTALPQLGLQSSNSNTTEVAMPVLEMQGVSPMSEILLQVEENKGGAVEMPSLSCDGGSTESQASGCVETVLPGAKETQGKECGSGAKGVCTIQSKKTEQTETADSSLEATTDSEIAESVAESPVG